jgi:hypothetical protein
VGTVKKFQKVSKVSKRGNFRRRKNCPKWFRKPNKIWIDTVRKNSDFIFKLLVYTVHTQCSISHIWNG